MARGTLSGMIAGTVVSGLVVGTASVMTEVPGAGAPETTAIEVPAGSEFDQSSDDTQAELPQVSETPDANDLSRIDPPQPDDLSAVDDVDVTSAAQPETGDTEVALNTPDAGESGDGVDVGSDDPVAPGLQTSAPEAPAAESDVSISTEPVQPAQPDVPTEESAFAEAEPVEEDTAAEAVESSESVDAAAEGTGAGDETADASDSGSGSEAEPTVVDVQDEIVAPQAPAIEDPDVAPDTTAEAPAEPESDTATQTAPEVARVATPEDTPTADPTVPEEEAPKAVTPDGDVVALVSPDTSSSTIDDIAKNVTTGRLPSVTSEPEVAPDATQEGAAFDTVTADTSDLPPIKRYAAAFENPDNKPLMSIVLIDDGKSPIGLDALESFPYPLNFAVDTGWSGAEDAMKAYRKAGFEVLAMVNLPEGAAATDTEVAMQSYLDRVPQAVAVMEGEGTGLQSSREASEQLAKILSDTGHGAVMFPNGLNTAQKLIAREGVPSASVFRDFDAKGQNASVIRRFLDQAAFRAGQEENGVIMVGRLRAETISALLLWGLQDRAGRVAVAPVSAVLDPKVPVVEDAAEGEVTE